MGRTFRNAPLDKFTPCLQRSCKACLKTLQRVPATSFKLHCFAKNRSWCHCEPPVLWAVWQSPIIDPSLSFRGGFQGGSLSRNNFLTDEEIASTSTVRWFRNDTSCVSFFNLHNTLVSARYFLHFCLDQHNLQSSEGIAASGEVRCLKQ